MITQKWIWQNKRRFILFILFRMYFDLCLYNIYIYTYKEYRVFYGVLHGFLPQTRLHILTHGRRSFHRQGTGDCCSARCKARVVLGRYFSRSSTSRNNKNKNETKSSSCSSHDVFLLVVLLFFVVVVFGCFVVVVVDVMVEVVVRTTMANSPVRSRCSSVQHCSDMCSTEKEEGKEKKEVHPFPKSSTPHLVRWGKSCHRGQVITLYSYNRRWYRFPLSAQTTCISVCPSMYGMWMEDVLDKNCWVTSVKNNSASITISAKNRAQNAPLCISSHFTSGRLTSVIYLCKIWLQRNQSPTGLGSLLKAKLLNAIWWKQILYCFTTFGGNLYGLVAINLSQK